MTIDPRLAFHYGLTIFLSAFLLFQVQPMIGKMILPWFGGSASVWTTCMLFFQMVLLLGYLYSHWVVRFLTPARQSLLHGALLLLSLASLPIGPGDDWKPQGDENPTLRILGLLAASIGLPYFVLSTTGPLIQAWFARERAGVVPYRLFALSNFGSMLALLSYPVAVEPWLSTRLQSWAWSGLFAGFALACGLLAWRGRRGGDPAVRARVDGSPAGAGEIALWIALAACPSIMLVADTSYLTENIAPIPMIWVAPLALYLLSFILCFESQGWYRRRLYLPLLGISLLLLAWLPTLGIGALDTYLSTGLNLAAFFVICMVCHGELALRQPHPSRLTGYFLAIAVGGCLGGFFVGVIAPYWFDSNYELSVGIVLTGLVCAIAVTGRSVPGAAVPRGAVLAVSAIVIALIVGVRVKDHRQDSAGAEFAMRNFYGTLKVFVNEERGYRTMMHGQIIHGRQFTDPARQPIATTYYSPDAGAGKAVAVKAKSGQPLRVGVVGLGVGTMVTYGRPGDYYRLYDIDPQVIDVARSNFTYLSSTRAETETILGDARLRLEHEPEQRFDVLVIDAFSGDSVPVHLLTREAFGHYFRHLKPDGLLAVHITNRFLDLRPVVATAAEAFGKTARIVDDPGSPDKLTFRSRWALVSGDVSVFGQPELIGATPIEVKAGFRPWRDDYSSLLSILL
jgi:SAM-dependent methyltransferase/multisubunit Na+/H+ antiporter MnhB subunit